MRKEDKYEDDSWDPRPRFKMPSEELANEWADLVERRTGKRLTTGQAGLQLGRLVAFVEILLRK